MKLLHVLTILFLLSASVLSYGQSDIEVSGFFQARSSVSTNIFKMTANVPTPQGVVTMVFNDIDANNVNHGIQQLNLFLRKEFSAEFSAWVNLETINTYSSERNWGALNLEEAWLKYEKSSSFIVKAGLLIPKFNRMNEVKNRMPLLPYISRPLVYEASVSALINFSDYLPERSFLQVYGTVPSGDNEFEYALHLDYSETGYINSGDAQGFNVAGTDSTDFTIKGIGGRIGANVGSFALGISGTWDRDNQQATLGEDVSRARFGADLGYTTDKVFFEGEFIQVKLSPDADIDADKMFYFATLGYNFTDKFYGYGSFSNLKDDQNVVLQGGLKSFFFGAGYRPIFPVHIKVQAGKYWNEDDIEVVMDPTLPALPGNLDLSVSSVSVALSVLF